MQLKVLTTIIALLGPLCLLAAPDDAPSESVEVRYARAQLQLAEANLKRVEERNKKTARSVPNSVETDYQHEVQIAKTRLEQATAGPDSNEFESWLERADVERNMADLNLKNATSVNDRVPGTFQQLDIERFRLRAEVAKLQLERGQALVNADREAQLQWKIDLLDNQVQRLKDESLRARPIITYDLIWWW
jgi:hypothetical protein